MRGRTRRPGVGRTRTRISKGGGQRRHFSKAMRAQPFDISRDVYESKQANAEQKEGPGKKERAGDSGGENQVQERTKA